MLIGKRVCLGPVMQDDGPILFNWSNSLEVARVNGPFRPTDETKFKEWLVALGKDPARVVFAIREQPDLRLLGYVHIINIQAVARTGEMGILIGDIADRGQGFGYEAMTMALSYCWRDLNLQRVSLCVVGDNPRAAHVYQKAGFQIEGTLRRASYIDGAFQDVTVMGALRPED